MPQRDSALHSDVAYVQRELVKKDFGDLPGFTLKPDSSGATPIAFLTNCCIYPVNYETHASTKTKTYYGQTGEKHLLNVTAAIALELADKGVRMILHLPTDRGEQIRKLFLLHPSAHLFTFIEGDLSSPEFVGHLYETIRVESLKAPISKVDFCLYDSYASGLKKPFLPMFEDSIEAATKLAEKRLAFLFTMSMVGYDLLVNKGQNELRLICPTALATRRPSSHLFTDTIHKALSNVLLVTLGYEMPYYTKKPVYVVEVAPGITDSGMYDDRSIRDYTAKEAELDGFAMSVDKDDVHAWPMLSTAHLAEVAAAYLVADQGECINDLVSAEARALTLAGRTKEDLFGCFEKSLYFTEDKLLFRKQLPEYCYVAGTVWNGFPELQVGYTPVMLTPEGQLF